MTIEIKLPELGDGIDSGDVLDVLVKEGDRIEKDQGIVELETDKATVEVPSTHAGRVTKILVKTGQSVPVGAVLIAVETAADAGGEAKATKAKPSQKKTEKKQETKPKTEPKDEAKAPPKEKEKAKDEKKAPAEAEKKEKVEAAKPQEAGKATTAKKSAGEAAGQVAAGPAVRRFAREVGVDLSGVTGTGEGGRITRDDVLQVVRRGTAASRGDESGETDDWGPIRVESMPRIRKTIAAKMHESWSTVPRVTNFDDADVTELEEFRQSSKGDYADKGIKLTSMPFVIKSVAMALKDHPVLNASVDTENGNVIYKQYVNVGIAVDTERGLVVPSLRHADKLSIPEIARELAMLAEKVRTSEYTIEDLRGGTFTISNLGAIGGSYSTPIINVPEVAILLVGRSRKLPVVVGDKIEVRLMMPLSLSYDHRLVDGAAAARFLNEVIGYLKAPSRLLLAP